MALDIYLSGEAGPRGCFTVMTAASEAVSDPEIRAMVLEGFSELDKAFAACFRPRQGERRTAGVGRSRGAGATGVRDHPHHRDPRPGRVPRKELEAIVKGAIDVMCGSASKASFASTHSQTVSPTGYRLSASRSFGGDAILGYREPDRQALRPPVARDLAAQLIPDR